MRRPALMLLYHCNVGYPVVADGARLLAPDAEVVPRDPPAAALLAEHATFPAPDDAFEQLVYEHRLRDRAATRASIGIANPAYAPTRGIALAVEYDPRQLPHLWQWRMLAPGHVPDGPGARDLRHPGPSRASASAAPSTGSRPASAGATT